MYRAIEKERIQRKREFREIKNLEKQVGSKARESEREGDKSKD